LANSAADGERADPGIVAIPRQIAVTMASVNDQSDISLPRGCIVIAADAFSR
jgi:hypothetical protein